MLEIRPLAPEHADPSQRRLFEQARQRFGRDIAPLGVTAHNPAILSAMVGFERGMAGAECLPSVLKELVNLKVAALLGCPFCIDIGSHEARASGVTERQLRDLPRFATSPAFSASERAALTAAEVMTVGAGEFDAALSAALRSEFDDAALVELLAVIAWENYRSRFNRAAGVQAAGFCALAQRAASERAG